jgi:hypothetical protein
MKSTTEMMAHIQHAHIDEKTTTHAENKTKCQNPSTSQYRRYSGVNKWSKCVLTIFKANVRKPYTKANHRGKHWQTKCNYYNCKNGYIDYALEYNTDNLNIETTFYYKPFICIQSSPHVLCVCFSLHTFISI